MTVRFIARLVVCVCLAVGVQAAMAKEPDALAACSHLRAFYHHTNRDIELWSQGQPKIFCPGAVKAGTTMTLWSTDPTAVRWWAEHAPQPND